MAKFKMDSTNVPEKVVTARLGSSTGAWTNPDYEVGKLVKLAGDSQYDLCAAGDAIEGQILTVESATADGWNIGSVKTEGRIRALCDGLDSTPGTGSIAVGDYVVCGSVTALLSDLTTNPKVCKATTLTALAGAAISSVTFPVAAASAITTGVTIPLAYTPGYRFKVVGIKYVVDTATTTSGKSVTLTATMSTGTVTNGALTVASTLTGTLANGVVVSTSGTTSDTGTSSTTVTITASAVTAFTEGSGSIQLLLQNMDTVDAIAKGAKKWRVVSLDSAGAVGDTATIELVS